jgi:hypothetical protein
VLLSGERTLGRAKEGAGNLDGEKKKKGKRGEKGRSAGHSGGGGRQLRKRGRGGASRGGLVEGGARGGRWWASVMPRKQVRGKKKGKSSRSLRERKEC